jgi:proline-specific peptidase
MAREEMRSGRVLVAISVTVMAMSISGMFGQVQLKQDVREGSCSVNGTSLYYRIEGDGDPVVVLHGGPGMSHEYLLPHLAFLADGHRLIFYDQRASGNSPIEVPPESVNIENFVRDLEGIRACFEIERVTLLGHSWGGLLAMHYAAAFPESTNASSWWTPPHPIQGLMR